MAKKTPPPPPPKFDLREWEPFYIDGIDVRLWKASGPRRPGVPKTDPSYVFREDLVREIAWSAWPHDNSYPPHAETWTPSILTGGKGSGKTSLVEQVAARCNIPVYRTNMNVGTTVRHLKGRPGADAGRTIFIPGIATMAMEHGAWLLLDELSGVTQPVALCLFPILEPQGRVLLEDAQPPRYVNRHPEFRIFATDNVIGAAREEDRFGYTGVNSDVNEALLDRFDSLVEVGYMPEDLEHKAVGAKVPTIDSDDLEGMIRVANSVRGAKEIGGGFSLRMLIAWARRVAAGKQMADGSVEMPDGEDDGYILEAARPAFLNKMKSSIERDAIIEVIKRIYEIEDRG